jgi:site-specific DNA-methyltransferase (adenine-specific)
MTVNGKKHFGMGNYVRASHETCIIAVKGRPKPLVRNIRSTFEAVDPNYDNILFEAPTGVHSEKPEFFYKEIVEKIAAGPYVELFGRKNREGWTVLGNQVGLLDDKDSNA